MAALRRLVVVSRFYCQRFTRRSIHSTPALAAADTGTWNRRWQPDHDIPATLEDKQAAARKYGLTVEDYETFDHERCGDYPKLPSVPRYQRDGHEEWDEPTMRRNFNEPFPKDWDVKGEDRYDGPMEYVVGVSTGHSIMTIAKAFGIIFLLYWFLPHMPITHLNLTPKQYPESNTLFGTKGEKHYAFPTKALDH